MIKLLETEGMVLLCSTHCYLYQNSKHEIHVIAFLNIDHDLLVQCAVIYASISH